MQYMYPTVTIGKGSPNVRIPYMGSEPKKTRPEDAAYDLRAVESGIVPSGEIRLVKSGTQLGIPEGYVGLVCSRSGLATRSGVYVLNAPGIVDPGYTGDVGIILNNVGTEEFVFSQGDRIAQLMIIKTADVRFEHALGKVADRGDQGFGSSGLK